MADNTVFQSRKARLTCSREEFYDFITDIRNFGEFVTSDIVKEWEASADSCRIMIPPVGEVKLEISGKEPYSLVTYTGDAMQKNEFNIEAMISVNGNGQTEVSLVVSAELNPFLKVLASGPIERFLETLVTEMENYNRWKR